MKTVGWAGIVLAMSTVLVQAANYINTADGGNWNDPSSWTLGSGTPGAGDTIALTGAGDITVTANAEFGATSGSSASSWNKSAPTPLLVLTNGAVLTHNANDTLTIGSTSGQYHLLGGHGGERFLNLGTIAQNTAWGGVLNLTNGVTLESRGLYRYDQIASSVAISSNSTYLVNDGTIQAADFAFIGAREAGATLTTHDGATLKSMNLTLTGGGGNKGLSIGAWNGQSGNGFTLTGTVAIASMSIASDSALAWANVDMTVSFPATVSVDGAMQIGKPLYINANGLGQLTLANSTTWNFGKGLQAYGGVIDTGGHTLTLQGTNTLPIGASAPPFVNSPRLLSGATGGVVNQGLLYVGPAAGADYYGLTVSNAVGGTAFVNQGTVQLRAQDASAFGGAALSIETNTTFSNGPEGVFVGAAPGKNWYRAGVVGRSAVNSVFDNQGTVHVVTNALWFYDTVKVAQISGTSLTGGTWKVSMIPPAGAPGDPPSLRLPGSNIQTIGAGATVVIENGGTINTIGSALTTVDGRFLVNGSSIFTNSPLSVAGTVGGTGALKGNLTVTNGGRIAPGSGSGLIGSLTVDGSVTIATGGGFTLEYDSDADPVTLDGLTITGSLTLPAAATVALTKIGTGARLDELVVATADSISAPDGLGGWTITASDGTNYKAEVQGNQLKLVFAAQGTVIAIQ